MTNCGIGRLSTITVNPLRTFINQIALVVGNGDAMIGLWEGTMMVIVAGVMIGGLCREIWTILGQILSHVWCQVGGIWLLRLLLR